MPEEKDLYGGEIIPSSSGSPHQARLPEDLILELTDELRGVAQSLLASERPGHTLQATALISELWLRMVPGNGRTRFNSRVAFMAYASSAVRNILVDHARRRSADKRGGGKWVRSGDCEGLACPPGRIWEGRSLLELDEELDLLAETQSQCAQVFEMRFFGGMSFPEVAEWLGITVPAAKQNWEFARAWLATRLDPKGVNGARMDGYHPDHA
ncbi:MAG: sigma-70 family RNA polymerase sigma factor [Phycisphaerales bacterium]|nr:sigma-70 family RNA polymerase sigma factor [Planctomycetota bacterium]MCH8507333.1 sigma-70 family RNA polymerase sigma factor [Phycisphaerales bacterium]